MAMFQFMGGEIALATAGEARRPMRNLPIAARYMYLVPISFYLVAILFVGLNINYLDPRLYHSHLPFYINPRHVKRRISGVCQWLCDSQTGEASESANSRVNASPLRQSIQSCVDNR